MSKRHKEKEVDEDELPIVALDHQKKGRLASEISYDTAGWKFYLRIKELLPDLWSEFTGRMDESKKTRIKLRYRDVEHFSKHKFKDHKERQWFIWMCSPNKVYRREAKNHKRYSVPWLGDWYAQRRNGYWQTENKEHIKHLLKAIKENVQSSQAIRATSPFIVKSLMRWERLADKVDKLFEGEPFVDEHHPGSKSNIQRFKLYMDMHHQVDELKTGVIHEWMRIHGVDPKNPHEMADMATMAQMVGQSAAAGALTGYTAAGAMQPMLNEQGKPNGSNVLTVGGQGIVIPPDALLLAQHLVKHSQTFKKPLPPIVEGELIEKEVKEKSNGHAKAN
jgi:hypothetical protein